MIESSSSLFNDSAVRAARKFKYKPRVVDGEPVAVSGVRNKISFRIEKQVNRRCDSLESHLFPASYFLRLVRLFLPEERESEVNRS